MYMPPNPAIPVPGVTLEKPLHTPTRRPAIAIAIRTLFTVINYTLENNVNVWQKEYRVTSRRDHLVR